MRTIVEVLRAVNKKSAAEKDYILYTYLLDDGDKIDSLQKFAVGEEVTTWFDPIYNKAKLRKKR